MDDTNLRDQSTRKIIPSFQGDDSHVTVPREDQSRKELSTSITPQMLLLYNPYVRPPDSFWD